jgi:hypothetical protein
MENSKRDGSERVVMETAGAEVQTFTNMLLKVNLD